MKRQVTDSISENLTDSDLESMQQRKNFYFTDVIVDLALLGHKTSDSQNEHFFPNWIIYYFLLYAIVKSTYSEPHKFLNPLLKTFILSIFVKYTLESNIKEFENLSVEKKMLSTELGFEPRYFDYRSTAFDTLQYLRNIYRLKQTEKKLLHI